MSRKLRVLIVEDRPEDAELVLRELRRGGFEPEGVTVDNEVDYLDVLSAEFDLILSDYMMPGFTGLRALELLRHRELEVPLIIVSGTIGEETAVEAMRLGATDYVLKDRLMRLPTAVAQALESGRLRRERRLALGALRESEERLRILLENAPAAIAMFDRDLRYLYNSRRWLTDYGLKDDSITGRGHYEVFPEVPAAWKEIHRRCLAGAVERAEADLFVRADGSQQWLRWEIYPWYALPGQVGGIVIFTEDITVRKQSVESLIESEERFRQLTESINEVFWITDPAKNQVLYVSPAYERIWGQPCRALYESPRLWIDCIHQEDRARVAEAATTRQALGTYDIEYRIIRPDTSERWIRDKAFPVRADDGHVRRIVGVAEDITERKKLEEQFLRAQRMEAIGSLAGGIAHDLNNILTPVLMIAPLLKEAVKRKHDLHLLELLEQGAERGSNIIKQLLTFSRGADSERGPVQPRHLLREIASILGETFPREITIRLVCPSDLKLINADATQIHQVLMNLCVNARDAMPNGGELRLAAENVLLDEAMAVGHPAAKPGPYVRLTVSDTGTGMPKEMLGRIFEPFFTTKGVGRGTGLGLSTVLGLVKGHGGFLTVESELGVGSVFRVNLPAVIEGTEPSPADREAIAAGNRETILVVDDEPSIRLALRFTLEAFNYQVLTAANGKEGLAHFEQEGDRIRLILTDLMMPVMNGVDMTREIRRKAPDLPIIAMSGLSGDDHSKEIAASGVTKVLAKPCPQAELLRVVHEHLD